MAEANGRTSSGLVRQLFENTYRFEFFQAVRLLELWADMQSGLQSRVSVGRNHFAHDELVRFRVLPAQTFPVGAISNLDWRDAGNQSSPRIEDISAESSISAELGSEAANLEGPRLEGIVTPSDLAETFSVPVETGTPLDLTVAFIGLIGPQGVLPNHYTSLVLERCHERFRDYSMRDFFDVLHHRVVSFYFRSWEKCRLPFSYERFRRQEQRQIEQPDERPDLYTLALRSLVGLGSPTLTNRSSVDDDAFLYYAGHFSHFPRSSEALEQVLCDYFRLPFSVEPFHGHWQTLASEDRTAIGVRLGRNQQLGRTAVVGYRVWCVQTRFRIRLGPVSYEQFLRFMPETEGIRQLSDLVRQFAGPELDFDLQIQLRQEEVPQARLGVSQPAGIRLGWNSWFAATNRTEDADDAVFRHESVV